MAGGRFRHLLDPALQVSRVLGLFPLDSGLRRSKAYILVTSLVFLALVLAVVTVIYLFMGRDSVRTERHRMILAFKMALLSLVPLVQLFKILLFVREVRSVVETVQRAERALSKANIVVSYDRKPTFRIALARVLFEFFFELTNCLTSSLYLSERLLRSSYFFVGMVLTQMIQLQLYCFLQVLGTLMSSLQLLLYRPFVLKELDVLTVLEVENRLEIACYDLNRVYSLQMLFIVVFRYLSFLSSAYDAVTGVTAYLTDSSDLSSFLELLLDFSWLLYAILDLLLLAKNCTVVVKRAEDINKALYKLLLHSKQKDRLYSSKLKLNFVYSRKITFTACGLFNLDFSLVHSVLASTLTFLVILMQMG